MDQPSGEDAYKGCEHEEHGILLNYSSPSECEHSTLGFGINGATPEVQGDHRFIADHPGVMPFWNLSDVARSKLCFRAIVHANNQPPGEEIAQVVDLAALGFYDRFHRFRPAPAGLKRGTHGLELTEIHDIHASSCNGSRFIRTIKVLLDYLGHHAPPIQATADLMSV